jgi:hypothetical protein
MRTTHEQQRRLIRRTIRSLELEAAAMQRKDNAGDTSDALTDIQAECLALEEVLEVLRKFYAYRDAHHAMIAE